MAKLQVLKGLNPGQQFPLEGETIVLGRHPDCDIVLEVGAVSRQHAKIVKVANQFYVEDLGSRNGTQLNGKDIQQRTLLKNEDRVKICDLLFTFHGDEETTAAGDAPTTNNTNNSSTPPEMQAPPPEVLSGAHVRLEEDAPGVTSTIMSSIDVRDSRSLQYSIRPEAKLKAFLEISQNLASSVSLDEVLPKILESLFKIFVQADRSFLLMKDPDSGNMVPSTVLHRRGGDQTDTIRVSKTIVNKVLQERAAILSADALSDSRFDMSKSVADFRIRSMMCVPMFTKDGEPLGLIQLDTQDQQQKFEQEDLDVLVAVGLNAAAAIENAQLHDRLLKKQAVEKDLEFARKVQQGFMPSGTPQVPGYSFFHHYQPARQVGGDYFDYVLLPDGRLAIVLADVAGKGVSAALLTAKLSSEVRYCVLSNSSPGKAVSQLNNAFSSESWEDRFVTLGLFVLDVRAHKVTIVNAGHMPPILRHTDGSYVEIDDETSLPLGVAEEMDYGEYTLELQPGEGLYSYTDGVTDAMNAKKELFGTERLMKRIKAGPADADQLGPAILEDVRKFIGSTPQFDDMCLIGFSRSTDA